MDPGGGARRQRGEDPDDVRQGVLGCAVVRASVRRPSSSLRAPGPLIVPEHSMRVTLQEWPGAKGQRCRRLPGVNLLSRPGWRRRSGFMGPICPRQVPQPGAAALPRSRPYADVVLAKYKRQKPPTADDARQGPGGRKPSQALQGQIVCPQTGCQGEGEGRAKNDACTAGLKAWKTARSWNFARKLSGRRGLVGRSSGVRSHPLTSLEEGAGG
ncbi:uncharacterized protein LOC117016833 isoform X2 [Rhinolophus ferrumequinum]|uniref:uncharacterized protein LOC117016833 isoform X2 n=1 Tax=Rhinolophus ferrumequinum TaxID=59479 RepID=UPI00140F653A|nr:uncharacterized protein LOC117016833 isoform X2 [Rhinolophus ferrumequinum]